MSGALSLAASIAAMDHAALHSLIAARRIIAPDSVQDPLSLAFELLRPDSITRALQGLDREALIALADFGAAATPHTDVGTPFVEQLWAIGLTGLEHDQPAPLPEVTESLEHAFANHGLSRETLHAVAAEKAPEAAPESSSEQAQTVDVSGWYAPAITSVRRAAALLLALREQPASLGRRGSVTVVSARELASTVHSDADLVARLLTLMHTAGLLTAVSGRVARDRQKQFLVPSSAVAAWMAQPLHARWLQLATTAWEGVGGAIHTCLTRSDGDLDRAIHDLLPREFPLMPEAMRAEARHLADLAHELGITVNGRLSPPIAALNEAGPTEALRVAEAGFPEAVPGVYVQPDLSVIIPGPLAPDDEQALSSIAEAEHWGVAVTLRITPASLQKAAKHGQEVSEIRSLLERLSLTGVPQPLDYLLSDVQRSVDVQRSADAQRATTGEADAAGLAAHLPLAEPPMHPADTHEATDTGERTPQPEPDAAAEIAARVLAAAQAEPGSGDLSRRLELAIRDRSPIRVTAAAGGQERSFLLLPVSLTAGRLRATDQSAGVQRTLPLSAIVSVEAG